MKNLFYGLTLLISGVISLALKVPALWAQLPSRGNVVQLGDFKSRVPADWAEEKPDARYYKQYRLEPIDDDKDYAQVTIRSLGKEKGGTAAAHVNRWKAMFLPPEGQRMHEAAKVRQFKIQGAPATYLDIRGDYKGIRGDDTTPVSAVECLHYALSLPTSVVITGIDSMEVLEQDPEAVRTFRPLTAGEVQALLAKTAGLAARGEFEPFKTSSIFDSTAAHPEWLGEEPREVRELMRG